MSTSTSTVTHTRTQTATHLSDVILGTIGDILGALGISVTSFTGDWDRNQAAISAWIEEASLKAVILECRQPDGTTSPIFEFPVTYEGRGNADEAFVNSRAAMARYQSKLASVPSGTSHRLFCTFYKTSSDQPGWSSGSRASTDGLQSRSLGSLAAAPHARADARYFS